MKYFLIALAVLLTGCGKAEPSVTVSTFQIPSYQELEKFPASCTKADSQLDYLRSVQRAINLPDDPEDIPEQYIAYNGLLKATIWWYAYTCNKS